jgi:hypothetical protein
MSKAILVIDMPKCCSECRFLNDNYDYPECIVTGETKGYTFRTREQKMDKCPLKPMPQQYDVLAAIENNPNYDPSYDIGYNTCIDEILGNYEVW